MKLLTLAFITVHTYSRIQGICTGIFGESTLQGDSKTWQESVDHLTRLEFVTEGKDKVSGTYALVIRKDTYFDKVITDYPAHNHSYQLEQHFKQLQKVLIGLSDSLALFSLSFALYKLQRHEEALEAMNQALRLNPNYAEAYYDIGSDLAELQRYEEALEAMNQALHLAPTDAEAYHKKGIVLEGLGRKNEAQQFYEKARRLGYVKAFPF